MIAELFGLLEMSLSDGAVCTVYGYTKQAQRQSRTTSSIASLGTALASTVCCHSGLQILGDRWRQGCQLPHQVRLALHTMQLSVSTIALYLLFDEIKGTQDLKICSHADFLYISDCLMIVL